ncbi:MAG TPA: LacI family DNA-binding transcriptional regulator [Devosia sp.]|nr:LacI family DNA-binding transcriptional regulator [Devosia sp.]
MSELDDSNESLRKRPSTIVDVANTAGVAIGTVSRYLNGYPVRSGNRDQIEDAIAKLGYRRNALAAAMKTDLTNIVGLMVPALSDFHAALHEQLSRKMRSIGRAVLSYAHESDSRSVEEGLDFFDAHRVDALIMDGHQDLGDRIRRLLDHGTPVVFYDNDVRGLPVDRVFVENRAASYRGVNHLLDIGHTRIACIAGGQRYYTGRERLAGYQEALVDAGIEIDPNYVIDANWTEDGGHTAMRRLLALEHPPTAVYSCNYNMTVGALSLLREFKLRVPDDLSLISFDDVPLFKLHDVGITAIAQPVERIAETITGMLLTRLNNQTSRAPHATISLDCDIILRGSTRRLLTPASFG